MAIIQLPAQQGLGTLLGQGLGTGLSTGLQLLAEQKLRDLTQRRSIPGLQSLGFEPEQASSLALLDPMLQKEVIKQKLLAPQQQAYAQALNQLLGQPEQQSGLDMLGASQQGAGSAPSLAGLTEKQATELAKLGLSKQKIETQKEQFERQFGAKEKSQAFKETAPIRKQILDASKAAKENITRLERMDELNKTGKLDSPHWVNILQKFGFDFPALLSPESQEFQKLTIDFLRDAKSVFGARISNYEAEQFLKGIPSLSQSAEGRDRVIRNLKLLNQASVLRSQAAREIIKENKGIPPLDLAEQVEDSISEKLDKLGEQFKKGVQKTQTLNKLEKEYKDRKEGFLGRGLRSIGLGKVVDIWNV